MKNMMVGETEMHQIELQIAAAPSAHPMIKGLRGVRKARFRLPGRGKSGGGRVAYYVAVGDQIFMMYAYPKSEQEDLTADQRRAILAALETIKGVTQ